MSALTNRSFVDVYAALPARQQGQLKEKAQSYIRALDQAIARVLSPTAGKADSQFFVTDEVIPLYGVGDTPQEAMDDYRSVVVEYYESLEEDCAKLGTSLQKQLEVLGRIFSTLEGIS